MITPYASEQLIPLAVEDAGRAAALRDEAESLPSLLLNSAAVSNAVMMAGGYFTPLTGYMNAADALRIGREMHTESGLFWPVPILNQTQDASAIAGALCSVVYSICPIIVLWAFARFPVLVVCGMFSPFCLYEKFC